MGGGSVIFDRPVFLCVRKLGETFSLPSPYVNGDLVTDVTQGFQNPPRNKLRPSRNGRVCGRGVAGFYLLDKAPK